MKMKKMKKTNNVVGHQDDLHFIHVINNFYSKVFCKWISLLLSYLLTFLSYSLFSLYSFFFFFFFFFFFQKKEDFNRFGD
jgi:hypothetical protein